MYPITKAQHLYIQLPQESLLAAYGCRNSSISSEFWSSLKPILFFNGNFYPSALWYVFLLFSLPHSTYFIQNCCLSTEDAWINQAQAVDRLYWMGKLKKTNMGHSENHQTSTRYHSTQFQFFTAAVSPWKITIFSRRRSPREKIFRRKHHFSRR